MWSLWVLRPISYYVAWLFIKLGISANQTTIIGGVIGIAGCVLLAFGSYPMIIIGVSLFALYSLSDCVDGAIARVTKTTSNYGHFLDMIIGYTIYGLLPLSVSICLYLKTDIWLYLILGGIYVFGKYLGIIVTLAYDKSFSSSLQTIIENRLARWGVRIILLEVPTLIICAALNRLEIFLGLFTLLFVCKTIIILFIMLIREKPNGRKG